MALVRVNHDAGMKEKLAIYRAVRSLTKRFGAGFTPEGVLFGLRISLL
jgi:hypothetical protein